MIKDLSFFKHNNSNKQNNRDNVKKRFVFGKKHACMLCILVLVLLEPVMLCGCASARDGIAMELSGADFPDPADSLKTEPDVENDANMTEASEFEKETQMVYIYVCGAVELPGVYCLGEGSRLYEAVEMAGGLTGNADDTCLNMAREIADGEQVVILTQEEAASLKESGAYPPGQEAAANKESGLVNINTADVAELTTVSGIGESRARAIIAYREKNGGFGSIEDIKKVEGIKDGLFSKIRDKITI